jgi:ribose 1,5-bisphosphokinase
VIDALTVFREDEPGAPFSVWRRFPFGARAKEAALPASGRLFYCVGPPGAGKDALLQWVKRHVPADARRRFAQRTVTRPTHASETHEATDEDNFWKLAAAGQFAMIWQANGLCYGIRRGIEAELKAGIDIVVNGSREHVPRLLQSFPQARVVWIEADPARIRERLEARRRESGAALLQRLDRATRFAPPQDDMIIRLDNSGPVEVAGENLLRILSPC